MNPIHERFLTISAIFVFISLVTSLFLIYMHQKYMCRLSIQPKIVGILWMVPIYSVSSFISLMNPSSALFLDMVRDCYEAYVLYLFLALMLSYLDAEQDEYSIIQYLDENGPFYLPKPLSYCFPSALPQGKAFLRYCKFGTLQYCVIRPLATVIAFILDSCGVYHESSFSFKYGYIYITLAVNLSIGYAFVVLVAFYTSLKYRLKPFKPVGKFLCIKFVIFFSFWQSIVIAVFVQVGLIRSIDSYYSASLLASSFQDFLICFEMMLVALAHLHVFSYKPFTPEGQYTEFMLGRSMRHNNKNNNSNKILNIHNNHHHDDNHNEEDENDSSDGDNDNSGQVGTTNGSHNSNYYYSKDSVRILNPWLQKKLENAALNNSNNGLSQDLLTQQHILEEKQLRKQRRAELKIQQHQQQQQLFVSTAKYGRHKDYNDNSNGNVTNTYIPPNTTNNSNTVSTSSIVGGNIKNRSNNGIGDDDDDDTVEVLLSSSGVQYPLPQQQPQQQQQQQRSTIPLDGGNYNYITQQQHSPTTRYNTATSKTTTMKRKSKTEPMLLEPQSPPSPVRRHFSLFPQPQRNAQQLQQLQQQQRILTQSQFNPPNQPPLPLSQRSLTSSTSSLQSSSYSSSSSTTANNRRLSFQSTLSAASASVTEVLNRHFAASSAVRDFNETMPVTILPVAVTVNGKSSHGNSGTSAVTPTSSGSSSSAAGGKRVMIHSSMSSSNNTSRNTCSHGPVVDHNNDNDDGL